MPRAPAAASAPAPSAADRGGEAAGARRRQLERGRGAAKDGDALQEMGSAELREQAVVGAASEAGPPPEFFTWFWIIVAA